MTAIVRTRFAPSPTGLLHIGGARTALFSWAFARHHKGSFILRVEDTDLERSTPEAVQAIIDGMTWLDLKPDEGPFFQMQRMPRYKEVLAKLLAQGAAYFCYTQPEELESLREAQRAKGEKPRYDGRWRPEEGKTLPPPPEGVLPVIRFKNPREGKVGWEDLVKGYIEFDNAELDDLIIARPDGTPTYNFCVVVDDWDMKITHVIRGDDHVNNTPRQINILKTLGAEVPRYAHLSMILGSDGTKLSKRHNPVSVMEYETMGYLPEAVINYLARLGWSHGDDEIFSREDLIKWFDLTHITPSAAQFNVDKLKWLNAHYIKQTPVERLVKEVDLRLSKQNINTEQGPDLSAILLLYKDRVSTLVELANAAKPYYSLPTIDNDLSTQYFTQTTRPALAALQAQLTKCEWTKEALSAAIKNTLASFNMKMPELAMPLRVAILGTPQTPSIDAVLQILGKERVLSRLATVLT